jgi:transcriptional regulator with PAS, ATPase and Fis domain
LIGSPIACGSIDTTVLVYGESGTGKEFIVRELERYKGNRRKAAEALNISTVTLWRKMKEYELTAI